MKSNSAFTKTYPKQNHPINPIDTYFFKIYSNNVLLSTTSLF